MQSLWTIKHNLAYQAAKKQSGRDSKVSSAGSITHSQWAVLAAVKAGSKLSIKELAGTLGVSASAATQMVEGLVQSGYLTRKADTKDRRFLKLGLTAGCGREMNRMKKAMLGRFESMFKILNDRELAGYAKLNRKVSEHILNKKNKS